MPFSRILVAIDGSESSDKVFDTAAQLAKLSGGKLFVVHVVKPVSVGGFEFNDASIVERLQQDLEERQMTPRTMRTILLANGRP